MLSRRRQAAALAAAGLALACARPAWADGGVTECDTMICLDATDLGTATKAPAGGQGKPADGPGGEPACSWHGVQWPCGNAELGWFNNADGCYWRQLATQPAAGDPSWAGHQPGDGAVYSVVCLTPDGGMSPSPDQWLQNPPPGYGGGVDLAALAQQAVDTMQLTGPQIGMAPAPGSTGLVGMPVWMWTAVSPTAWGPNTKSVTAGAVTVTATAHATQIAWSMGDGHTVTCTGPGTPYDPSYGAHPSPDCGHTYTSTSARQDKGKFHVGAVTTWSVDWTGAGRQGHLTLTRTSAADVAVAEAQAVVKP
ncbi:ATP/GTP-binding protein [Kitasatospora sp. NPDC087861]|uniref:ATP/GTP-binding protein n=1 Tax=Kitasatospora sp. NPDC087861 TaxID=3364070 RepID=UPI0037FE1DDE